MTKKHTILISVILLAMSAALASVAVYAWFVTSERSDLSDFQVTVVGAPKLTYEFARSGDGITYVAAPAESSFVDEHLLPGQTVYCRIIIRNNDDKDVSVRVDFTGVVFAFSGVDDAALDAALDELNAAFLLGTQSGSKAVAGSVADGVLPLESVTVAARGSVNVDYTFALSAGYTGSGGTFRITAAGIRFSA